MDELEHARDVTARLLASSDDESKMLSLTAEFAALSPERRLESWCFIMSHFDIRTLEKARVFHRHLGAHVLSIFGVPMGSAGVHVIPTVNGRPLPDPLPRDKTCAELIADLMKGTADDS